ncbi:MAG: ATP synthase F1 subunit epsilon [Coriobacteriia bacterium]|nr:ATP synthase F1 subunit epsilon [Coriobacteriia bacterium]
MAKTLICEVVTPVKKIYSAEAAMVTAPAINGEVGILPLHAPYVSILSSGEVRVSLPDEKVSKKFAISGGYLEVKNDEVIILADRAIDLDEIDRQAVQADLEKIEERLTETESGSEMEKFLTEERDYLKTQLYLSE